MRTILKLDPFKLVIEGKSAFLLEHYGKGPIRELVFLDEAIKFNGCTCYDCWKCEDYQKIEIITEIMHILQDRGVDSFYIPSAVGRSRNFSVIKNFPAINLIFDATGGIIGGEKWKIEK